MKTLSRIVFGSRLYGTNTPNSDTDFKGVYMPSLNDILLQGPDSHTSDSTKEGEGKNSKDDVDTQMFSLDKFVRMGIVGETVVLDMLAAEGENVLETSDVWKDLVANRHRFYSKSMKAFLGYIRRQTQKYGIKGSRLNVLEEIIKTLGTTAIQFHKLLDIAPTLPNTEYSTFETKSGANGAIETFYVVCGKYFNLNTDVSHVLTSLKKIYDGYGHRAQQAKLNDGIDWKACSHAIRVGFQLRGIYLHGGFKYPLKETQYLIDVKTGKLNYLKEVAPVLEGIFEEVSLLASNSNYPETVDVLWWEEWLLKTYKEKFHL